MFKEQAISQRQWDEMKQSEKKAFSKQHPNSKFAKAFQLAIYKTKKSKLSKEIRELKVGLTKRISKSRKELLTKSIKSKQTKLKNLNTLIKELEVVNTVKTAPKSSASTIKSVRTDASNMYDLLNEIETLDSWVRYYYADDTTSQWDDAKKYEKLLAEKEEQLKQLLAKPKKQKPLINILQDLIPFVGFKESEVQFDKKHNSMLVRAVQPLNASETPYTISGNLVGKKNGWEIEGKFNPYYESKLQNIAKVLSTFGTNVTNVKKIHFEIEVK
jgi:hypothetical protein